MQQRIGKLPSMAWLLKIETGSILIKEKHKHLSKTSDRVSKLLKRECLKFGFRESSHRSIYQYTKFVIVYMYACMNVCMLVRMYVYSHEKMILLLNWPKGCQKNFTSLQKREYFVTYFNLHHTDIKLFNPLNGVFYIF